MKVLNASHLADTGGNGIRTKRAFDRHTDWTYRTTCRTTNYIAYPTDLPWSEALGHWIEADVVHVRDGFQAQQALGAPERPTVIHHHGTQFRLHRRDLLAEQRRRGAVGVAATLDLYVMAPDELVWVPAIFDLGALARIRAEHRPTRPGPLRIAHAPTNRSVKSTAAFLAAAKRLSREIEVEVVLVERASWAGCLRRKAVADIYYDQVRLGYGNNAVEAWGMGIPVVAGADGATLDEMVRRFGDLPFVLADEGSILAALRRLAEPGERARWSAIGAAHAARWHDEAVVVELLKWVYERAAAGAEVAA